MSADRQRIDKWLFFARVAKSRTLAAKLAQGGHVRVNGAKIGQASHDVKPGDVLTVTLERRVLVYKVVDCGARRGPAPEARLLYEDLSPPPPSKPDSAICAGIAATAGRSCLTTYSASDRSWARMARCAVPLEPKPVAAFHAQTLEALDDLGIHTTIQATPNEVHPAIPFVEDHEHSSYDADAAQLVFTIKESGEGFDFDTWVSDADSEQCFGRGIALVKELTDSFVYLEQGTKAVATFSLVPHQ